MTNKLLGGVIGLVLMLFSIQNAFAQIETPTSTLPQPTSSIPFPYVNPEIGPTENLAYPYNIPSLDPAIRNTLYVIGGFLVLFGILLVFLPNPRKIKV